VHQIVDGRGDVFEQLFHSSVTTSRTVHHASAQCDLGPTGVVWRYDLEPRCCRIGLGPPECCPQRHRHRPRVAPKRAIVQDSSPPPQPDIHEMPQLRAKTAGWAFRSRSKNSPVDLKVVTRNPDGQGLKHIASGLELAVSRPTHSAAMALESFSNPRRGTSTCVRCNSISLCALLCPDDYIGL